MKGWLQGAAARFRVIVLPSQGGFCGFVVLWYRSRSVREPQRIYELKAKEKKRTAKRREGEGGVYKKESGAYLS